MKGNYRCHPSSLDCTPLLLLFIVTILSNGSTRRTGCFLTYHHRRASWIWLWWWQGIYSNFLSLEISIISFLGHGLFIGNMEEHPLGENRSFGSMRNLARNSMGLQQHVIEMLLFLQTVVFKRVSSCRSSIRFAAHGSVFLGSTCCLVLTILDLESERTFSLQGLQE